MRARRWVLDRRALRCSRCGCQGRGRGRPDSSTSQRNPRRHPISTDGPQRAKMPHCPRFRQMRSRRDRLYPRSSVQANLTVRVCIPFPERGLLHRMPLGPSAIRLGHHLISLLTAIITCRRATFINLTPSSETRHRQPARSHLHAHVHSPPPTQLRAQQLAYPTPEHVFSPGGHGVAPPSTQPQPELAYAQYHSQSPPTPPHQRQQGHHSPRQQAQTLAGHPGHGTAPHLPDNHSTQPYAVPPGSTLLAQPYSKSSSPAPPPRSYVPSQAPSPPVLSHIVTQPPVLVPHARPYTANVSPVLSVRPQVASPGPGPSVPPTQSYFTSSSSISPAQPYAPTPAPSVQPYAPTSVPPAQTYVSPTSSALSPPIHPRPQSTTPSPPVLPYISPPNSIFPLPTSPPPMAPYGPSYTPGPMLSFPTPSFPVPQATAHHENPAVAPFPFGEPEPDLHDPYLLKRYQTPLPLPPGASHAHASGHHAKQNPRPSPPVAAAPAAVSTRRVERESESERAARELQRLEEESARVRREQEERDAELARTLDLELNMDREAESAPPDGPGRLSRRVPPLRT
ncbi:hypothetical protein F5148DRAFT_352807 [Russula earlei]|uniref:Uncharacterized protein n=1 Tax=Russula earlei TaxID=71964 RepID=A0ACC0U121_9AGAM|nr:hypothetical protein F5148DRAFT_352807 [Russula earlei]